MEQGGGYVFCAAVALGRYGLGDYSPRMPVVVGAFLQKKVVVSLDRH